MGLYRTSPNVVYLADALDRTSTSSSSPDSSDSSSPETSPNTTPNASTVSLAATLATLATFAAPTRPLLPLFESRVFELRNVRRVFGRLMDADICDITSPPGAPCVWRLRSEYRMEVFDHAHKDAEGFVSPLIKYRTYMRIEIPVQRSMIRPEGWKDVARIAFFTLFDESHAPSYTIQHGHFTTTQQVFIGGPKEMGYGPGFMYAGTRTPIGEYDNLFWHMDPKRQALYRSKVDAAFHPRTLETKKPLSAPPAVAELVHNAKLLPNGAFKKRHLKRGHTLIRVPVIETGNTALDFEQTTEIVFSLIVLDIFRCANWCRAGIYDYSSKAETKPDYSDKKVYKCVYDNAVDCTQLDDQYKSL